MICPFYDSFSVPIVGPRGARRTAMPVVPQSSRAPLPRGSWAGAPACPRCRKRNQAAGDEAQKTELAPASSLPPRRGEQSSRMRRSFLASCMRRSFSNSAAAPLSAATRRLLADTGAKIPIVKGPMYPGSNPELVAAVSEAGGFGVVQPISLTHLYGHDFREGLRLIKSLTSKPFGVNFTILDNAKYKKQMEEWMEISVDEGVKFFLTSLGKPEKIVRYAQRHGIKVYHDVHTPEVARKVADQGVDGLNCLNSSMGGQTGK